MYICKRIIIFIWRNISWIRVCSFAARLLSCGCLLKLKSVVIGIFCCVSDLIF